MNLWSYNIVKNTYEVVINKMIEDTGTQKLYKEYMENYKINKIKHKSFNIKGSFDRDFDIRSYENLINLLQTTNYGNQIFEEYFNKLECNIFNLVNSIDYMHYIFQFLDENDKINLCKTNKLFRQVTMSPDLCPLYYKLDDTNFLKNELGKINVDKFLSTVKSNVKLYKLKILKGLNNVNCSCKYFEPYNRIRELCDVCELKRIIGYIKINMQPLFGYDFSFRRYCAPIYNYSSTPYSGTYYTINNKQDEDKELIHKKVKRDLNKLEQAKIENKIVKLSLSTVYSNNKIKNFKIETYDDIITKFKKNYEESKNEYKQILKSRKSQNFRFFSIENKHCYNKRQENKKNYNKNNQYECQKRNYKYYRY